MFQNQRLMEKIKTNLVLMDKMILFFVYSLVTISTIFVYSATRSQKFVMQNLIWIGLGTFLMFLISFIDYKEYKDHIWKIYGLSAVLLILVRIAGKKTGVGIRKESFGCSGEGGGKPKPSFGQFGKSCRAL